MVKSCSNFQQFVQEHVQRLPKIALIGIDREQEEAVCWDLIVCAHAKQNKNTSFEVHKCDELSQEQLLTLLNNYVLFPTHRLLGIFALEKLSETTKKSFIHHLSIFAKSQDPFLHVILWARDKNIFDTYMRLSPDMCTASLFGEYAVDRNTRKVHLLVQKANHWEIQCSSHVAAAFIKKFPQEDGESLTNEFHKLLCFVGEKKCLDIDDIETFVEKQYAKSSLWNFRDAIFKKNLPDSIRILENLIEDQREEPLSLLYFLRFQCIIGLQACEKQYVEEKNRIYISFGYNALKQALSNLFYTEEIIKQNKQSPTTALYALVVRMAS